MILASIQNYLVSIKEAHVELEDLVVVVLTVVRGHMVANESYIATKS